MGDKNKLFAGLAFLAQEDQLDQFIENNKFFIEKITEGFSDEEKKLFRISPNQPKYLQILFDKFFTKDLGLPESEAVRLGLNIMNYLSKEKKDIYREIAYFDVQDNS